MLFLACMAFVVRTAGYMLIQRMGINILLLDLLHGMSYALSQSAGVTFVEENTPNGYEASGQGLLSLTRGVGASVALSSGVDHHVESAYSRSSFTGNTTPAG